MISNATFAIEEEESLPLVRKGRIPNGSVKRYKIKRGNTCAEKLKTCFVNILKTVIVFVFLYLFVCSLELLTTSFQLLSGKSTGSLFNNTYLKNPLVGLMLGILLTVLVQSSSTATSIIVSMVGSNIITVTEAIPIVMGSNIGTSVTNTLVSLTQVSVKENFRRSFAGATVHDMFNWLNVLVLLPLEVTAGPLNYMSEKMVNKIVSKNGRKFNFLKQITTPFTNLIIQVDEALIHCWSLNFRCGENSIIKKACKFHFSNETEATEATLISEMSKNQQGFNLTQNSLNFPKVGNTDNSTEILNNWNTFNASITAYSNNIVNFTSENKNYLETTEFPHKRQHFIPESCIQNSSIVDVPDSCKFLFYNTQLDDTTIGAILLVLSIFLLCISLLVIVKILNSLLEGSIARLIQRVINADIPYVPWLTGYLAILIGAILTFIVQSSSVFTSTMTPLIGIGIISVERAYPLTLGSNVGTTSTALVASLAVDGNKKASVQIAIVHLLFNAIGILIFYPIPCMRIPITLCKILGNTTARYRWFAILYIVVAFLAVPGSIFTLSLAGTTVLFGVMTPIFIALVLVIITNVMQRKCSDYLPTILRNWNFLPEFMRSLQPYDKFLASFACCKKWQDNPSRELDGNCNGYITYDAYHSYVSV